jgi:hypothetical protein
MAMENKYKSQNKYYEKVKNTEGYKKAQKERSDKWYIKNKEKRKKLYLENREERIKKVKDHYWNNLEKSREKSRKQHWKHRDKHLKYNSEYYEKNKEKLLAYKKIYSQENKVKIRVWKRENSLKRYHNDLNYKIKHTVRRAILKALKGKDKSKSTLDFLGCSIEYFWDHLESKFTVGMTKKNHGRYGWHIDHKIPCASFDLTCPIQQLACFHYSNLQPLWARDNIKKGAK